MRDKIIEVTIQLLDNLGVKFTIDDIRSALKISKKTIYKYFSGKEELAQAVFDTMIERVGEAQKEIMSGQRQALDRIIMCLLEYMKIYRLQSEKIFNLYRLNLKLRASIQQRGDENWREMVKIYQAYAEHDLVKKIDEVVLRIIIEGIFKNIEDREDREEIGYLCILGVITRC